MSYELGARELTIRFALTSHLQAHWNDQSIICLILVPISLEKERCTRALANDVRGSKETGADVSSFPGRELFFSTLTFLSYAQERDVLEHLSYSRATNIRSRGYRDLPIPGLFFY